MKKDELESIGERLRSYRQQKNLSQEAISERIGVSAKFYGMIERGEKGMSLDTLVKLRNLLDIDLNYLLFGETEGGDGLPLYAVVRTIRPDKMPYAEEILAAFAKSHERL